MLCTQDTRRFNCACLPGYSGTLCEKKTRACSDVKQSGIHTLYGENNQEFQVGNDNSCDHLRIRVKLR